MFPNIFSEESHPYSTIIIIIDQNELIYHPNTREQAN